MCLQFKGCEEWFSIISPIYIYGYLIFIIIARIGFLRTCCKSNCWTNYGLDRYVYFYVIYSSILFRVKKL